MVGVPFVQGWSCPWMEWSPSDPCLEQHRKRQPRIRTTEWEGPLGVFLSNPLLEQQPPCQGCPTLELEDLWISIPNISQLDWLGNHGS